MRAIGLVLIGTELDKRRGAPIALLGREGEEGLQFAGGAFFTLKSPHRDKLRDRIARLGSDRSPIPALRKRGAQWIKPELIVGVRHLCSAAMPNAIRIGVYGRLRRPAPDGLVPWVMNEGNLWFIEPTELQSFLDSMGLTHPGLTSTLLQ